jgi:hypothetical protein
MAVKYIEGTTIKTSAVFKDVNDALVDPADVKILTKDPDAIVTTLVYGTDVELVKDSTGNYHAFVTLDKAGKWIFRWESSGQTGSVDELAITVTASQVI